MNMTMKNRSQISYFTSCYPGLCEHTFSVNKTNEYVFLHVCVCTHLHTCNSVTNGQTYNQIDISNQQRQHDSEMCTITLEQKKKISIIWSLFEAPNVVNQFMNRLHYTLKYLYNRKSELLIYGNINTDYQMKKTVKKTKLIIHKPHSSHTVNFATEIQND